MSSSLPRPGPPGQPVALKDLVKSSQETYRRDLRALFEHASDRFGDVKWEELDHELDDNNGPGTEGGFQAVDFAFEGGRSPTQVKDEVVWAHKGKLPT
jgi:hypothetical protein